MDRLRTLETFAAVADAASFAGGARALGISAPSATRAINALEARLGVRLFARTTRHVRLNPTGVDYLTEVRRILADLRSAEDAASGAAAAPRGTVRLTCPVEFGRLHATPALTRFLRDHPEMSVHALMTDRIVNIVEEGYDLALRIGHLPSSGLTALKIGEVSRVLVAAPAYLDTFGHPADPRDLAAHETIETDPFQTVTEWRFGLADDHPVRLRPRLVMSSVAATLEAAASGWGIARALSYQVSADLTAGRLVRVLPDWEPHPMPVHLVHAEGRGAIARIRTLMERFRTDLSPVLRST